MIIKRIYLFLLFQVSLILNINAQNNKKPNIIFLLSDDQSIYSIGAYGNPEVKTPHMDQLSADGVTFDRHYNTTAICMASRANIFTGKYEYKTGTNFHLAEGKMRKQLWADSYPVLIKQQGYLTAFAGKFGIEVQEKQLCEEDFDFWAGSGGQSRYETKYNNSIKKYAKEFPHSTLAYGAFGQDVIRESVKKGKPFCLSISFKAPHKPATPDPRFKDIYANTIFTKPVNYGREHSTHMSEQSKQGRQYSRFKSWDYNNKYNEVMRIYHQQVYAIDVALGMIRKELENQGIAGNTVIIYTSDNGFICGAHGYGSKVLPMEESSRAPLIIFDPRSTTVGRKLRSQKLTANIDFAPTILALAGATIPKEMDGKSLLTLIENPTKGGHEQISFINRWGAIPTHSLSCITQQYKYTYWWYEDTQIKATEELYDIKNDKYELTNLAKSEEHTELLKTMRNRYDVELERWKSMAVQYNDYNLYNELFDRNYTTKQKAIRSLRKSQKLNK